jgi:hypothetical protein
MAKSKSELTEVRPAANAMALPDYVQAEGVIGTEGLRAYVTPPRFKIVQKQSNNELLSQFGEGDVIVLPDTVLCAQVAHEGKSKADWIGEAFRFTPLFFFAEWCVWNPIQMKGTLSAIRARTMDPRSPIAIKARNKEMWSEPCPENPQFKIRYCEHLNFIVTLHDGPYAGSGIVMSFAKGSHFAGSRLCNLIQMRKAPIFSSVFEARSTWQENSMGEWWSITTANPPLETGSPWVSKEQLEMFKALHLEFKGLHEKLLVDYGDADDDSPTVDTSSTGEF